MFISPGWLIVVLMAHYSRFLSDSFRLNAHPTHGHLLLVRNLTAIGFVHEHEPIPSSAFLHLHHRIVRVSERNLGKKNVSIGILAHS
jgi:hypothetical protein